MSILIVDDSIDMRYSLKTVLEAEGLTDILTANSARQAYQLLGMTGHASSSIDAILMDIRMPHTDGIAACSQIRAHDELKDIPVIMVTGLTDDEDLKMAFAAGAVDYVTKPIKIAELLARLRSALSLKEERDRRKAREKELLDVTNRPQEVNQALQRLTVLDELTGVANRRCFNATLEQEWARSMRDGSSLALLMIDIDFFKAYNDYCGHQQGDECLRQVAGALKSIPRRPADLVARYGGEEFAVVLPSTQREGAARFAETLRAQVECLNLPHQGSPTHPRVTISVGVAVTHSAWPQRAEVLVSASDQALYEAKRSGRNNVKVYEPRHLLRGGSEPETH